MVSQLGSALVRLVGTHESHCRYVSKGSGISSPDIAVSLSSPAFLQQSIYPDRRSQYAYLYVQIAQTPTEHRKTTSCTCLRKRPRLCPHRCQSIQQAWRTLPLRDNLEAFGR